MHGIKLKKIFENGLSSSDSKAVLKTLYNMKGNSNGNKIGICRDENINGLLHNASLGCYVINLDDLRMFHNSDILCPSNKDLIQFMKSNPNKYQICDLHERLKNNQPTICAKVKAEYLAEYCQKYEADLKETMDSLLILNNLK